MMSKPDPTTVEEPFPLPPLPPLELVTPLGDDTLAAWRAAFVELNKGLARLAAPHPNHLYQLYAPIPARAVDEIFAGLQQPLPERATGIPQSLNLLWDAEGRTLRAFWKRPELTVVHLLRFGLLVGAFNRSHDAQRPYLDWGFSFCLESFRETHPEIGLRELAHGFRSVGLDPAWVGRAQLSRFAANPFPWPAEQVWPYWAERLDLLQEYFLSAESGWLETQWTRHSLEVLATFPRPPARFVAKLWDLALGTVKADRAAAQICLQRVPDKVPRLLAALASGKAEARTAAADWLRRIREASTVEPLLAALRKEKNEVPKGAIMSALEQLGVPVEQFLDRSTLLAEAEKGLAKGVPDFLAWFPFDLLPGVHWEDNGKPVAPEIVRWWLVQNAKFKNPEPGPLLRRYCLGLRPGDREALGRFILDTWIAYDRAQPPPGRAMPGQPPSTQTPAIEAKGLLAVASACGGPAFAPTVQQYLKEWYGLRAAQCRALLQMLAWVEHPAATQVLLATGSRFRTKSIQEEASKQVLALAERKGWSLDELSDRTVPSAGLDEHGVLDLDFGPRRFTARLNAQLELTLSDPEGKPMKALPEPRKDDDPELAAFAKKTLGSAKKELKSVLSLQRERLYEAMCVQRRWRFEDWSLYLQGHPILRHYTPRLVWAVFREDAPAIFFRPLPDGSLTAANDEPVKFGPDESIGLAHESHAAAEVSSAWREHLRDYAVEPLFEQFGQPTFTPEAEQKRDSELRSFEGHLVEAFKLRGRAAKLGYGRGQSKDGGWFYVYCRRFPSLGIEVVIEFTGNSLPEENRTVALRTLYFQSIPGQGEPSGTRRRVRLGEIPSVLLSECWNDLRQLAREGPGFDPAWKSKTAL